MSSRLIHISLAALVIAIGLPISVAAADVFSTTRNNYKYDFQNRAIISIGDTANSFRPKWRVERWESSWFELNMNVAGNFGNSVIRPDGTITAGNTAVDFTFKPTGLVEGFNDFGGVDFILTLKQKPLVNIIAFAFNSQNVDVFHQPALPDEIDRAGNLYNPRPEHIVNSIAFYSKIRVNNEFKTGKIGHLYRMRVRDSSGGETWADWGVLNSAWITLTIPQDYLDKAVFPITLMPVGDTFGFTSFGATRDTAGSTWNRVWSVLVTCPSSGTMTKLSVGQSDTATGANPNMGGAIYDSAGTTLIDKIEKAATATSTAQRWLNYTFTQAVTGGVDYNLAWYGEYAPVAPTGGVWYDSGAANTSSATYQTVSTWPASITVKNAARKYSMYITYTPSGGGGGGAVEQFVPRIRIY